MRASEVRERLINVNRVGVAHSSFRLLDSIQTEEPALQLAASAAYFLLLSEHYKQDPQEVFTITKNLMRRHDDSLNTEFEGIRMFLKEERW